jgi:hypothetical protein
MRKIEGRGQTFSALTKHGLFQSAVTCVRLHLASDFVMARSPFLQP